jgi:hypothetical protein
MIDLWHEQKSLLERETTMKIGTKKADAVEVQMVGNNTIVLITQENDMLPSKLDTILLVNVDSIDSLIDKLNAAKQRLKGQ